MQYLDWWFDGYGTGFRPKDESIVGVVGEVLCRQGKPNHEAVMVRSKLEQDAERSQKEARIRTISVNRTTARVMQSVEKDACTRRRGGGPATARDLD